MEIDKIRVAELFAGYGGASFALKKAKISYETVFYSEIDKYAIQCYNQNHPNIKNYGDCTKIVAEDLPDFDLLTGGFPCQAFSIAGKGQGELDTRGTLFHEIIRIAEVKKPKYMLLENVKGLISKPHKATYEKILSELKRIGYDVIVKEFNSKDYGIPQNRERLWFICKLGKWEFGEFKTPVTQPLIKTLKQLLEPNVDRKYYLSDKSIDKHLRHNNTEHDERISKTIIAGYYKDGKNNQLITTDMYGNIINNTPEVGQANRIYSEEGIVPALNTGWTPNINTNKLIQLNNPKHSTNRIYDPEGLGRTLRANAGGLGAKTGAYQFEDGVRKLTPTECFRLMGFINDEIKLDGLSDTQKYKLAGNGWEINIASKILKGMLQ